MALVLLAVCLAFFLGGAEVARSWTSSSSSSCRNKACESNNMQQSALLVGPNKQQHAGAGLCCLCCLQPVTSSAHRCQVEHRVSSAHRSGSLRLRAGLQAEAAGILAVAVVGTQHRTTKAEGVV